MDPAIRDTDESFLPTFLLLFVLVVVMTIIGLTVPRLTRMLPGVLLFLSLTIVNVLRHNVSNNPSRSRRPKRVRPSRRRSGHPGHFVEHGIVNGGRHMVKGSPKGSRPWGVYGRNTQGRMTRFSRDVKGGMMRRHWRRGRHPRDGQPLSQPGRHSMFNAGARSQLRTTRNLFTGPVWGRRHHRSGWSSRRPGGQRNAISSQVLIFHSPVNVVSTTLGDHSSRTNKPWYRSHARDRHATISVLRRIVSSQSWGIVR